MNNTIAYVAPKNKTWANTMSLNNNITCVVAISIFGFRKYWQMFFNLMEINMSPTFKYLLQSKIEKGDKNKSYYQRYYVKITRAFQNQTMKHQ